jgi:hypothetical protein
MASLQDEFNSMQKKLIRATTLRDEALRRLESEFGCTSLEQAEKKLSQLDESIQSNEAKLQKRLAKFRATYPTAFGDEDDDD